MTTQDSQSNYQQGNDDEYNKDGSLKFGNQDKKRQYDLSELNIKPDHVVVRHYSVFNAPSGQEMEDPGSSRIQVYEKEVFDRMSKQKTDRASKQTQSDFDRLGQGTQVLHIPAY